MKICVIPANNGDSILLHFVDPENNPRNILIDGGTKPTYGSKKISGALKQRLAAIRDAEENIDLLIVTHIDDDHIGGIVKWFSSDKDFGNIVKEVWFNSGKLIAKTLKEQESIDLLVPLESDDEQTSVRQGVDLSDKLAELGIGNSDLILSGMTLERMGLKFKILSPTLDRLKVLLREWRKEDDTLDTTSESDDYSLTLTQHLAADVFLADKAIPNGSSIAFLLEAGTKRFLFLGDSHSNTIVEGLGRLGCTASLPFEFDAVKLSHHGSANNTSPELLSMISADKFIISTNGATHKHPHKQALARVINANPSCKLCFNYPDLIDEIFLQTDYEDFPDFRAIGTDQEDVL